MSAAQLRTWAQQQGVEHWLDVPARVLQGHLKGAWFWMYRNKSLTLEQILTLPTARGAHEASDERMPLDLQEAAVRLLEEQAGLMAEGLSDESAHLAALTPPLDHRLRGLWERLWSAREQVRSVASPRAYRLLGPVELSLEEDPPQVVYREQTQGWCGGEGYWPEVRVDLQPEEGVGVGAILRCRCPHSQTAQCAIGLSALDACLNVLGDGRQPDMRDRIARLVSEPRWNRALDALDRLLQRAAPEGAERPDEEALGWRLRAQPGKPLELEPVRCRPLKGGEGLRSWKIEVEELLRDPQLCSLPIDQEVLTQLYPAPEVSARTQPRALWQALVHRAVSRLVGHPRVLLNRLSEPVRVVEGHLSLRWEQADPYAPIHLLPDIDGQSLPVPALLSLLESQLAGGLLIQADEEARLCRVVRIEAGTVELLERLLSRGSSFPPEAAEALIARREAFERLLPVQLAAPLRGEALAGERRPVLRLQALEGEVLRLEVRVRPLPEGASFPPGEGPRELYGERRGRRVYVSRELSAEPTQVRAALAPLGLLEPDEGAPFRWTVTDPHAALALMEAIDAGGWSVEWAGPPRYLTAPAGAGGLTLAVGSRRDWFGLKGSLRVGGLEVPLERLLQAVWEGRPFLVIEGGGWLRLEEDFRDRLAQAAAVIFPSKRGGLEVSPFQASAVQALAELGASVSASAAWVSLLERVQVAQDLDPEPPAALTVTLRDYQRAGLVWMARLAAWGTGACLADDMGLGKTVQALSLLALRAAQGPALVVAPTSVCFNWLREAARICPPLRLRRYLGADRQARLADLQPGEVLVVSYGLLTRDIDALAAVSFATVVFDEAQALKNPSARRTRAARRLQAGFCLALTGTPIENHVGELWSLFSVVSPGLLGAWDRFRDRFVTPIAQGDRQRQADLAVLLRPFLLRRLKSQVAAELPDRTEVLISVQLSEAERLLYDRVRLASLAALTDPDRMSEQERRFQVLAAITRLRQIACHPQLYDPTSTLPSAKLARLREIVAELRSEGHRALLFSQFTRHLQLARDALAADGATFCYLDGSTPEAQRQREVERFQAGEGDLFFISLKAGGTGLTLTAATYVIHLDPWWNPAVEDQATDRAHRIGQRLPVTVYRLVSHGTIEASMLDLHAEKRQIVAGLLGGAGQAATLDADALVDLIAVSGRTLQEQDAEAEDEAADTEAADTIPDAEAESPLP